MLAGLSLRGAAAGRLLLQHVRRPGRGDQGAVGAGREPAAAAQRPDPEPRRDGEGHGRSRSRRVQGRSPTRARSWPARRRPRRRCRRPTSRPPRSSRLLVVVENYPQLQVERVVQPADGRAVGHREPHRRRAHALQRAVQAYNTSRRQFPANITAKIFGFKEYPFFKAPPEAKEAPKVAFPGPPKS